MTSQTPSNNTEFNTNVNANANSDLVYVKASCHCTLNTFLIPFSSSKLPISNDLCHCNTCRHSSGQLGVYHISFEGVPLQVFDDGEEEENREKPLNRDKNINIPANLNNLIEYKSSPISSRLFCKSCGAHMLWHHNSLSLLSPSPTPESLEIANKFNIDLSVLVNSGKGPKEYWAVAAGTLERIEGIAQVDYHIYVEDTKDGGLADHFRGLRGEEDLKRWAGLPEKSELLPRGWRAPDLDINSGKDDERLRYYCQCGGIEGYITRPKKREAKAGEWWAPKGDKFFAGQCGCASCRKTSGFEINSWGLFPIENVQDQSGEIDFGKEDILGLTLYRSSTGCRRYFCGTCGATVFFLGEVRPGVVDVGLGLVDESRAGARAEGWLDWHRKLVFGEMMLSRRSRESVEYGLCE